MTIIETISAFQNLLSRCATEMRWNGAQLQLVLNDPIPSFQFKELEDVGFYADFVEQELNQRYIRTADEIIPAGSVLNLQVPRLASKLAIVRDVDDLMRLTGVKDGKLQAYVMCDTGRFQSHIKGQPTPTAPAELKQFHDALNLWEMLVEWGDHTSAEGTILFFGLRLLEIAPGFEKRDLKDNDVVSIQQFKEEADRQEVRKAIFKSVLSELLRDQLPDRAFAYLLGKTSLFSLRLKEGLTIYLSEHSPEKLQQEAEKQLLEFSEKVEKLVSGLEAKSLTIPAALLVAFKEVAAGAGLTTFNGVTLGTTVLYGATMTWSHITQSSLVNQIEKSVDHYITEIQMKGLNESNRALAELFPKLKTRIRHAGIASLVMCVCSWVPLVAVGGYAWLGTPPPPKEAVGAKVNDAVK